MSSSRLPEDPLILFQAKMTSSSCCDLLQSFCLQAFQVKSILSKLLHLFWWLPLNKRQNWKLITNALYFFENYWIKACILSWGNKKMLLTVFHPLLHSCTKLTSFKLKLSLQKVALYKTQNIRNRQSRAGIIFFIKKN